MQGKRYIPIPMILHPLRLLPTNTSPKPNLQIRSSAEYPPITRYNDTLDLWVSIEHGIRLLNFAAHGVGEGIVLARTVKRKDDDARFSFVVCSAYGRPLFVQIIVAVRENDVGHVSWGHLTR